MSNVLDWDFGTGPLRFSGAEEFREWVEHERAAFAWLLDSQGKVDNEPSYVGNFRQRYRQYFAMMDQFADQFVSFGTSDELAHQFANRLSTVARDYGPVISTRHKDFTAVDVVRKSTETEHSYSYSVLAGTAALAALSGWNTAGHFPLNEFGWTASWNGIIGAHLTSRGLDPRAVESLKQTIAQAVEDARVTVLAHRKELDQIASQHAELRDELRKRADETDTNFSEQMRQALAKIEGTDAAFRTQMQLQAPVEYWTDKAAEHGRESKKFRQWSGYCALIAIVLLTALYAGGLCLIERSINSKTQAYILPLTFYVTGFIAVMTSGALWWVRMVVRLFMSHKHLGIDAEERAAMIKTYLAFTAEGKVSDSDRALILAPIFRPTADGIVKDDGAPTMSLPGLLAAALEKRN